MATMRSSTILRTLITEIEIYFRNVKGFTKDSIYDADVAVAVTRKNGDVNMYISIKELEERINYDEPVSVVGMVRMPFNDGEEYPIDSFVIQTTPNGKHLFWSALPAANYMR